jgi:hypothetical protein
VKITTDGKRSLYIEDCFEKSERTTAEQMTVEELNIRLESPVSTKTV